MRTSTSREESSNHRTLEANVFFEVRKRISLLCMHAAIVMANDIFIVL